MKFCYDVLTYKSIGFCNAPHFNHFFVGLDCKMVIIQVCEEHKCPQGKSSLPVAKTAMFTYSSH